MKASSKVLFVDRDGTLIREPEDKQADSLEKIEFIPGVFKALDELTNNNFSLVMVSNQDGLGTDSFPEKDFMLVQEKVLALFASQGIVFADVLICPHFEDNHCDCRKPRLGLVLPYLRDRNINLQNSYVIGDRASDMELAKNMGIEGFRIGYDAWSWAGLCNYLIKRPRTAQVLRKTKETELKVQINLDINEATSITSGIPFFDHMLDQLAKHSGIGLILTAKGDLEIDDHHTVEDTALALGQAISEALGDKRGIGRYGFSLPMDESRADVILDLSGRPFFKFTGTFTRPQVGSLSTEMVPHFFQSLAFSLGATLHMSVSGENSHHMVEALFKGFARALGQAVAKTANQSLPSTKGIL